LIRYDLQCAKGHAFDAWFRDSKAFDTQVKKAAVTCPICGTSKVEKQLMTPGIGAKSNQPSDVQVAELMERMREMRRKVEAEADYVGDRFAEEARRIHYEESEMRAIYGEATFDEAKALLEEGISVAPLPTLPEDKN
jgi:hypothetical protein